MHLLGNFYFVLGLVFLLVIILEAPSYGPKKKITLLVVVCLILLSDEKPDWFIQLLRDIKINH